MKPYSLQNFTFKLKTAPRDKDFEPANDVIYYNQWTECNATILDEFNNRVKEQKTVKVWSDSHVDFRDTKIKKGRLHFCMKSSKIGDISVFIKIGDFTLRKEVHVTCSPCSSALSDMRIEKVDSSAFVYRVYIFNVFGDPVYSNMPENCCELKASFQSSGTEVKYKTMSTEHRQICYDITVIGKRPWSRDLVVLLNGKQIKHPEVFEMEDEECKAIDNLSDKKYNRISSFFNEDDSGLSIPLTTGIDDGKFVKYDEHNCELQSNSQSPNSQQLVCKNVKKYDFFGAENAHIHNIKRVLKIKDYIEIKQNSNQVSAETNVIIDLSIVQAHLHSVCKEVVLHLLRGLYYRKKASEAAQLRMEWKNKQTAIENMLPLSSKYNPSVILCKFFKDFFGGLMNKYNREACEELFHFFNFHRDEGEVDLHGLLVADEEKLETARLDMLQHYLRLSLSKEESDKWRKHVDGIICQWRSESDEAIRKLKESLESFDHEEAIKNKTPWLEIIVGAGHLSRIKNEQRIRPIVEKHLKERNLKFAAVNKGALVVRFEPYRGPAMATFEFMLRTRHYNRKFSNRYVAHILTTT